MKGLLVAVIAAVVAGVLPAGAQSASERQQGAVRLNKDWKRVSSGDVTAVGDASEKTLREALAQIASFRAAFKQLYPTWRLDSPVPYRVVRFQNPETLRRFAPRDEKGRPQQFVGGYFSSGADLNIIALGGGSTDVVFHEFTHSFVSRNFHSLPMWLNEGLADFHATFEADWQKGRSLMGRPPAARLTALRRGHFMPLKEVVLANSADIAKFWRLGDRIAMFYAESWALVHYLHIGRRDNKPGAFGRFVSAIERGTPVEQAFQESFGATIEQIDGELRRYIRNPLFLAINFELARNDAASVAVEPMTEADVKYIQGDLLNRVGAFEEADKEVANALALDPAHVPARVALANARLGLDRGPEAIDTLKAIVEQSPSSFAATYHLARALAASDRHLEALEAYSRATKLVDGSPNAWYGLSVSAMALGRVAHSNAAMTLAQQRRADPGWYRTRAYAALSLGLDAAAAADARKYLALAGWEGDTVYAALVAAIAHRRLNQLSEAAEILESARHAANVPEWTFSVIDYLDDRLSSEAILKKARDIGEKTEAHAYVGFKAAAAGRKEEALTHFRWVLDQGARNYVEFGMAKAELKRLETAAPVDSSR
jgi:tetratricopeptide (TPR) repeat protein